MTSAESSVAQFVAGQAVEAAVAVGTLVIQRPYRDQK